MGIVIAFDLICMVWLIVRCVRRGYEETLPVVAFLVMLFPSDSSIPIPGLFDLTTQRLIVLTMLALYFAFGRSPKDGGIPNRIPIAGLLILQIVWMCVATANSVVFTVSLKTTLSQILDFFTLFYLFAKGVRSTESVHKVMMGFVSAMMLLSVFAAIEYYFDWSLLTLFPVGTHRFNVSADAFDRVDRVRTTFDHPILFGGALALAIPAALYLFRFVKSSMGRIGLALGTGLMFLSIYKTDSRGPWLALVMSCFGLMLLGGKQLRKAMVIIVVVVVTTLLLRPGIVTSLVEMYKATNDPDSPMGVSYQWRYALYDLVKVQLGKNPERAVWGYGPESFYYLGLTTEFLLDGEVRTVKVDSCDSSVAALMMETGYLGFVITALMLLAPVIICLRAYLRTERDKRPLLVLFVCNMGAYYFLMTNVAIYGWGQQSYILWIVMALASVYPSILRREEETSGQVQESAAPEPPRMWGSTPALPAAHAEAGLNS